MRMISPKLDAPQVTVAEEQEDFKPITAAICQHPQGLCHVLAFRLNEDERKRIANGEDFYVSLLTFGGPMQGIITCVGEQEAANIFGVVARAQP